MNTPKDCPYLNISLVENGFVVDDSSAVIMGRAGRQWVFTSPEALGDFIEAWARDLQKETKPVEEK